MNTNIEFSPSFSMLHVDLDPGESFRAEPGAMVAMSGVEMDTGGGGGGLAGGIRRALGGESFLMNSFRGGPQGGWVALAPGIPGDVFAHTVRPDEDLYIQSGSFLGCTESVALDSRFQGLRSLFSGESSFFLRASAEPGAAQPGQVFCNAYGAIREYRLDGGAGLVVDTGHLAAFTSGLEYSVTRAGGIRSALMRGEGLVLHFESGHGSVWVQTRNLPALAARIIPLLPRSVRKS